VNSRILAAVPAWVSTLALVFSIGLPTAMWQAFYRAGKDSGIDGARKTSIWLGVILSLWVAAAVFLSLRGFFEADPDARVPHLVYALLPLLCGLVLWPASRSFRGSVRALGPDWIIRIQIYRTLGLISLVGWYHGLMPRVFAMPAGVGDLLVGLSAPGVAWMVRHGRPGAASATTFWNFLGLADVVIAVTLGALSSPSPFQVFAKDAPGIAITTFPLVLLPTIVVPLSVLCHFCSLRVGIRSGVQTKGQWPEKGPC